MNRLLQDLRIVEISAFVAAPLGGMTMAQLGAEVIRIDPIGGGIDFNRWPVAPNGASLYWAGLNKAKRSVALALDMAVHETQKNMLVFGLPNAALRALPVTGNRIGGFGWSSVLDALPCVLLVPGLYLLTLKRRRLRLSDDQRATAWRRRARPPICRAGSAGGGQSISPM